MRLSNGPMNVKCLPAVLLFLAIGVSASQRDAEQKWYDAEVAAHMEKSVTVHAEFVSESYCRADDETFSDNLNLKLRFTNASARTVILSRKVESINIVRVARDAEAASRGDFLYAPDVHSILNKPPPDAPSFGAVPSRGLFAILASSESYETVVKIGVFAITGTEEVKKGDGLLGKGNYVLQVGVHTWPYDWPEFTAKESPHQLKRRWAKYGALATGLVFSDLASFTIPERLAGPPCS